MELIYTVNNLKYYLILKLHINFMLATSKVSILFLESIILIEEKSLSNNFLTIKHVLVTANKGGCNINGRE